MNLDLPNFGEQAENSLKPAKRYENPETDLGASVH